MKTIAEFLEEKLRANACIADALLEDIVNVSALARKWKPWLEEQTLEEVSVHSISMALRRMVEENRIQQSEHAALHEEFPVRKVLLQTNLVEYVFAPSMQLTRIHKRLMDAQERKRRDNVFLHFSQGIRETAFIVSDALEPELVALTKNEKRISRFPDLTAISLLFPYGTEVVPGIFYKFLQPLAWEGITIVEILSTWSELTFIVQQKDEEEAFAILRSLTEHVE